MAQVINRGPGIGALLGQGLGTGFNQGVQSTLDNLIKQKASSLERRNTQNAYEGLHIPKDIAASLVNLPPDIQKAYLQRLASGDFQQQGQQQAQQPTAEPSIQELVAEFSRTPQKATPDTFQESLKQLSKQGPALSGQQALQQAYQQYQKEMAEKQGQQQQPQQNQQAQVAPQQAVAPLGTPQTPDNQQKKPATFTDILSRPSPGEQRLENRSQRDYEQRQQHHNDSRYGKQIQDIYARARAKHTEDAILKRTIATRESGKVRNAHLSQALKVIGIDYEALKNKETLEVQKLQNYFLRGGKEIFGGRITNFDAAKILESVPSLLQTDEGATWLANQMLNLNKQDHEEARITNEILKQNKGNTPDDFDQQLYERMEPFYEKWTDDFVNGAEAFTTKKQHVSALNSENATLYKDKVATDHATGKKFISDGKQWSPYVEPKQKR